MLKVGSLVNIGTNFERLNEQARSCRYYLIHQPPTDDMTAFADALDTVTCMSILKQSAATLASVLGRG